MSNSIQPWTPPDGSNNTNNKCWLNAPLYALLSNKYIHAQIKNFKTSEGVDANVFGITRNKVIEELINNELDANELLQQDTYFVSDIVDYKRFTYRDDQKIIKSTHHNINKIMSELFGKDNVPKIGRRHKNYNNDTLVDQNVDNPLQEFGNTYLQKIIDNNNSIFRAYANCYYWMKNELYNVNYRKLGYINQLQTDLSNYFKA